MNKIKAKEIGYKKVIIIVGYNTRVTKKNKSGTL